MTKLRVAGATLNQVPIDWKNNFTNIAHAIELAKEGNVDILCLPELTICGYGCEDLFLSEWLYEQSLKQLLDIKSLCRNITVAVGLPMKFEGRNYNVACLIHDCEIVGFTAKQFLAEDGVHYEPRWFTQWPADRLEKIQVDGKEYHFGDVVYQLHGIKIGFEICEDAWRKDQRPAYRHAKKGVNLILNPSASHFSFGKSDFRENLVIPVSDELKCSYVFANMLGNESGRIIFDGEILIAQHGKLLKKNRRFSFENVNVLSSLIDFEASSNSESTPTQDSKEKEIEFTRAETLALFDYMRKSRSKGFVISLSGGADSSSCSVLVAEMIRRGVKELGYEKFLHKLALPQLIEALELKELEEEEHISKKITQTLLFTAYQGTVNSSEDTFMAAKTLAESIGATFYAWTVDEEVANYRKTIENCLSRNLNWDDDDIALQNIQARVRIPGIWMLANIKGALLIATNNRSEADVGYTTMDGDTSGSIAPIAAVDKFFILHWLKWANKKLNYPGLSLVNSLNPTAELRPLEQTQTDENDLMPYQVLMEIERQAIRYWLPPTEVYQNLKVLKLEENELLKCHIKKFFRLWARNQWKRERVAPAFHIDDFNVDPKTWCRFPILSGGFEEELKALDQL
ncbi:NAD+ synthase (glutamine-hydrolyzing) [Catalinimonas alkaloidigena]|uniref:NAD(+) synthase n=1 Tax=Catalinimonas alkaloidigena TaxID=1075417 RepID=UPI0024070C07|nr:NAD(+) synthase [Catalinimonas alkaloidigena]MDF9796682.1 NAD+ synthase (glutamine-hydrolyzing) [Catalinimonas alkaloidigena]